MIRPRQQSCSTVQWQHPDWFRTTAKVRQGYLLSPILFNMFLERMMCEALDDHDGSISIRGRLIMIVLPTFASKNTLKRKLILSNFLYVSKSWTPSRIWKKDPNPWDGMLSEWGLEIPWRHLKTWSGEMPSMLSWRPSRLRNWDERLLSCSLSASVTVVLKGRQNV